MVFTGSVITEDEFACILANGPMKMAINDARRIASILKNPQCDRMFKYAVLIGMGVESKRAASLARELDQALLDDSAIQDINNIAKKVGNMERLENNQQRIRAFLHVLSVSGVKNWSKKAKELLNTLVTAD